VPTEGGAGRRCGKKGRGEIGNEHQKRGGGGRIPKKLENAFGKMKVIWFFGDSVLQ
jgi:hypothetical protein